MMKYARNTLCFVAVCLMPSLSFAAPVELTERRTENSETFYLGGDAYQTRVSVGPMHYRDDPDSKSESWKSINTKILQTNASLGEAVYIDLSGCDWAIYNNTFKTRLWNDGTLKLTYRNKEFSVKPSELAYTNDAGDWQTVADMGTVIPSVEDSRIVWPDAFGAGLDFEYMVSATTARKGLHVPSLESLALPTVGGTGVTLVLLLAVDWSTGCTIENAPQGVAPPGQLKGKASKTNTKIKPEAGKKLKWKDGTTELWIVDDPFILDANGDIIPLEYEIVYDHPDGTIDGVFAAVYVPLETLQAAAYPLVIDPSVTVGIDTGTYDGYAYKNFSTLTETDIAVSGHTVVSNYTDTVAGISSPVGYTRTLNTYWYFESVAVPNGVTITSSYITINVNGYTKANTPTVVNRIYARDVDTAPVPTSTRYQDTTTYPWTTAYVNAPVQEWGTTGTENTPDISTVIQELVDRAGWVSGNNMWLEWRNYGFTVASHADDLFSRMHSAYTSPTGTLDAQLYIEWSTGGGTTGPLHAIQGGV